MRSACVRRAGWSATTVCAFVLGVAFVGCARAPEKSLPDAVDVPVADKGEPSPHRPIGTPSAVSDGSRARADDPPSMASEAARRWNARSTTLTREGPAPGPWSPQGRHPHLRPVWYTSDGLRLRAWLALPEGASAEEPVPGLVFLHGWFAYAHHEWKFVRPAFEQGYAILIPQLRGENGGAGTFEFLLGEANDALAASVWLAEHEAVDSADVWLFGQSVGAGLSALLALAPELPVALTGGAGGLYEAWILEHEAWAKWLPFAPTPDEIAPRVLPGQLEHMQRPHVAFLGDRDLLRTRASSLRAQAAAAHAPLGVVGVEGDHVSAQVTGLASYLSMIPRFRAASAARALQLIAFDYSPPLAPTSDTGPPSDGGPASGAGPGAGSERSEPEAGAAE